MCEHSIFIQALFRTEYSLPCFRVQMWIPVCRITFLDCFLAKTYAYRKLAALSAGVSLYLTTPQAEFLRGRFISANWAVDDLEAQKDEIVKQNLLTTYIRAKFGPGGHFAQQ